MGFSLFSQTASDKTCGNSLKMCQGMFKLYIWKNFFTESMVEHWNKLTKWSCFPWSRFKRCVDMVLMDPV